MSTHATIGVVNPSGSVAFIYKHTDGYPEGVGDLLLVNYGDRTAAAALIASGERAASDVLDELQAARDGYERCIPSDGALIHRQTKALRAPSVEDYRRQSLHLYVHHVYLFQNGEWLEATRLRHRQNEPWFITAFRPLRQLLADWGRPAVAAAGGGQHSRRHV